MAYYDDDALMTADESEIQTALSESMSEMLFSSTAHSTLSYYDNSEPEIFIDDHLDAIMALKEKLNLQAELSELDTAEELLEELEESTCHSTASVYELSDLAEVVVSFTNMGLYPQTFINKLELPEEVARCYTPKPEPIDFGDVFESPM